MNHDRRKSLLGHADRVCDVRCVLWLASRNRRSRARCSSHDLATDVVAQQIPVQIRVRGGLPGQPVVDGSEEQTTEGVFHGDQETRKQLKKAKKLLEDGRFSEALPLLDDILESSQDYFDSTQENQVARNGLKSEAQRLIGSQSAEGLKAYELLFGAKAERMLADALAAGDMAAVAEVGRRCCRTRPATTPPCCSAGINSITTSRCTALCSTPPGYTGGGEIRAESVGHAGCVLAARRNQATETAGAARSEETRSGSDSSHRGKRSAGLRGFR